MSVFAFVERVHPFALSERAAERLTHLIVISVVVLNLTLSVVLAMVLRTTADVANKLGAQNRVVVTRDLRVVCRLASLAGLASARHDCGKEWP